jgi:hypothetical protein
MAPQQIPRSIHCAKELTLAEHIALNDNADFIVRHIPTNNTVYARVYRRMAMEACVNNDVFRLKRILKRVDPEVIFDLNEMLNIVIQFATPSKCLRVIMYYIESDDLANRIIYETIIFMMHRYPITYKYCFRTLLSLVRGNLDEMPWYDLLRSIMVVRSESYLARLVRSQTDADGRVRHIK